MEKNSFVEERFKPWYILPENSLSGQVDIVTEKDHVVLNQVESGAAKLLVQERSEMIDLLHKISSRSPKAFLKLFYGKNPKHQQWPNIGRKDMSIEKLPITPRLRNLMKAAIKIEGNNRPETIRNIMYLYHEGKSPFRTLRGMGQGTRYEIEELFRNCNIELEIE